ncbi:hypothetical protein V6N11_046422 [Hibiscus sabdariffa]|uniref:VAN3-binding protein-like auxin canalisation domain-containing protein n=1 Tax=Hibiscus sabdariffa TaxID=183260 RepID=A0ABR2P2L7_9ROSI
MLFKVPLMASLNSLALLAIFLALHLKTAKPDFLSPLLQPIFDDVCKEVECGKGKCNPSSNGTLPYYTCECDAGWKQTAANKDDDHPKFLPCIFPNCTLNTAFAAAPSPVQEKAAKENQSVFDICRWSSCGGGSCNKTSPITYDCKCSEGYFNLLNVSAFPCYRECAIGMDCANLGISVSNRSTSVTPASSVNDVNRAGLKLFGYCHWLIMSVLLLAMKSNGEVRCRTVEAGHVPDTGFLSCSWSVSALEVSKALSTASPQQQKGSPRCGSLTDGPPISPSGIDDVKEFCRSTNSVNVQSRTTPAVSAIVPATTAVGDGKTGRWLKDRKEKKKEETRAHNAQIHASISVAGVAAGCSHRGCDGSFLSEGRADGKTDFSVASAATLAAPSVWRLLKPWPMGAEHEHLPSAISSAVNVRTAEDIMTLNAGAATGT